MSSDAVDRYNRYKYDMDIMDSMEAIEIGDYISDVPIDLSG